MPSPSCIASAACGTAGQPPGWYGKLPSLGDFASRRLDAAFIRPWDDWLCEELAAWREAAPHAWLDAYLAAPSWCFVLQAGALAGPGGRRAWAGVLMPSVDRIGRYFPFTLARPLPADTAAAAPPAALWARLRALAQLAAQALQDDWDIDRLETALHAGHAGRPHACAAPATPTPATATPPGQPGGGSLWLACGDAGGDRPRQENRLPRQQAFRALWGARPP